MGNSVLRKISILSSLLIFISGCLPGSQAPSNIKKTNSSQSAGDAGSASATPIASDFYWFSGNVNAGNTLIVNSNIKTNIYLRGKKVDEYLNSSLSPSYSDSSKFYCIVFGFDLSSQGGKNQMRVRAVPFISKNFVAKTTEKLFRVDLEQGDLNKSSCDGVINSITSTNAAYSPSEVCPSCKRNFSTVVSSIKVYAVTSNTISDSSQIKSEYLNTSALNLRIDVTNSTSDETNSICTTSQCLNLGYDCCLEGQCVKNGQVRANASSYGSEYTQAVNDVSNNYSRFIFYPNIYYICPGTVLPTPVPTVAGDLVGDAEARFKLYKQYYLCLQNVAYCNDPLIPAPKTQANVDSLVQKLCGCKNTSDPTTYCNKFSLKAIYPSSILEELRTNDDITNVECVVVNANAEPTPFQDLAVTIPSRAVPHRFFKTNGDEVENLLTLKGTPITDSAPIQEGTTFKYLNMAEKSDPSGLTFNMNSILGQMSILLNESLPAKIVKVQFDQTYIIGKTQGFYTPCPTCAADSWFNEFKPFPASAYGTGVQGIGYSTTRDNYGSNFSYANYEDTHFGRACYIPPTMIPWSHMKFSDVQKQRLNRLKTQAALYINGYQKDWYGFNLGTLIGSFDGVSWFSIGKSRRVRATTNRLYLAINAPFADLADVSDMVVHVYEDRGGNTASDYDYDPNLSRTDARQNEGGSCQAFHKCETDKDCITSLGWEYVCAEIFPLKTNWPIFDPDAKEKANLSDTKNFAEFLQSKTMPSGDTKRCVYRGMGAPCTQKPSKLNRNLQKLYSCAPNFYCAKLNSGVFNDEIARVPNGLSNILYGMEADVLGRPKNYVNANKSLPTDDVIATLYSNASTQSGGFNDVSGSTTVYKDNFGLCRPQKAIAGSDFGNKYESLHYSTNSTKVTDYVNQIGGCYFNAPALIPAASPNPDFALKKVIACPSIDPTGNYFYQTKTSDATPTTTERGYIIGQNSCGAQALNPTSHLSPFKDILFKPITSSSSLMLSPGFSYDACFRKAGSVCHSDYDCSPNKLFADEAGLLPVENFGNIAEHNYWKEYLVCAQGQDVPFINDKNYSSYKLSENRCCRANGETLTMYSGKMSVAVSPQNFSTYMPETSTRYSRYEINTDLWVDPGTSSFSAVAYATATASFALNSGKNPKPSFPFGLKEELSTPSSTPSSETLAPYQWKTINDTGSKTCCGTWIRKFSDGTHIWKDHYKKLNFNVSSFKCLNYSNILALDMPNDKYYLPTPNISSWADNAPRYYQEWQSMCLLQNVANSTLGGKCAQADMVSGEPGQKLVPPTLNEDSNVTTSINTMNRDHDDQGNANEYSQNLNNFVPYFPVSANSSESRTFSSGFDVNPTKIEFYLPAYIDGMRNLDVMRLNITCEQGVKTDYSGNLCAQDGALEGCPGFKLDGVDATDRCIRWKHYGSGSRPGLMEFIRVENKAVACYGGGSGIATCTPAADPATSDKTFGAGNWRTTGPGAGYDCDVVPAGTQCDDTAVRKAYINLQFWEIGKPHHIITVNGVNKTIKAAWNSINPLRYSIGSKPGADIYYEDKLSRFELTGIPQIVFEPIYCNSNHAQLVPDLFKSKFKTREEVQSSTSTCNAANKFFTDKNIYNTLNRPDPVNTPACATSSENVALPTLFSENEFVCCVPLGSSASNDDKCCSSFRDKKGICKLPSKTDLHLYLNKYVSGEGMAKTGMPGGGLIDSDFDSRTGYPKLTNEVFNKISAFGKAYCENEDTRMGAAFGKFAGEPTNASVNQTEEPPYSIVDSSFDKDSTGGTVATGNAFPDITGFDPFIEGYRWRSHVYCK